MTEPTGAPRASTALLGRLSVMMFLQFAVWGAWLPFLWSFLTAHRGMSPDQVGNIFAAGAVGAIIGPFIAGQVADRYFATEKFLGVCHLLGAVMIWQLSHLEGYGSFLLFSLLYGIVYSPTLALTNSLSFHHLPDKDREFGKVRLWGTLGWIVVGLAMGQWLRITHSTGVDEAAVLAAQIAGKADAFKLSAILGGLMGLYCFSLPHTPPSKGAQKNATLEAMGEVKRQPLLTLFLLAVPVSCIHQFYFVHTEGFLGHHQLEAPEIVRTIFGAGGGGLMTLGQMSELLVLAAIPFLAVKFSRKTFLAVGLLAYAARMALFAYVDVLPLPAMVTLMTGVALHGLCFGCFIFVAFMIVDENTTSDVRASAQNLFNLVIVGIGIIVGSKIATAVAGWATPPEEGAAMNFTKLFSVPMVASVVCLVLLLIFYPGGKKVAEQPGA